MESQDAGLNMMRIKLVNVILALGKEMKAANKAQNVKFNEFSRRTEQQLLDLNTTLQTILAQASNKGKRNCKYSDLDLSAGKRARTLVECLQQETCGG